MSRLSFCAIRAMNVIPFAIYENQRRMRFFFLKFSAELRSQIVCSNEKLNSVHLFYGTTNRKKAAENKIYTAR